MKGFKKLTAGLMGVVMALGVCGFTALAADKKGSCAKAQLPSSINNNASCSCERPRTSCGA